MKPAPPVTPIQCLSPGCSCLLGHCTPGRFIPAGSNLTLESRVVMRCPECGKKRTWRPGEALDGSREQR